MLKDCEFASEKHVKSSLIPVSREKTVNESKIIKVYKFLNGNKHSGDE